MGLRLCRGALRGGLSGGMGLGMDGILVGGELDGFWDWGLRWIL